MTPDEKEVLARLKSYGNMSRDEALELHRLLNLEEQEVVVSVPEVVPAVEPVVEEAVEPVVTPVVAEEPAKEVVATEEVVS